MPNNETISVQIPYNWTIKKLKNFVLKTFEDNFINTKQTFIYQTNILEKYNNLTTRELFKNNKINIIIINLKKQSNELKEDLSKMNINDLLNFQEFKDSEKITFENYCKSLPSKKVSYTTFPIMNPVLINKITLLNNENSKLSSFDPGSLEKFPVRDYFKFEILFRLIVTCFVMRLYTKDWKFPIFITVFIIYYWFNVKKSVEEYYKKKIDEIQMNESEIKEMEKYDPEKFLFDLENNNNESSYDINSSDEEEDEKKDDEESKNDDEINTDSNNKNNKHNINFGANPNYFNNLDHHFPPPNFMKNEIEMGEMEGIENLLNKKEEEEKKKKKIQLPETKFEYIRKCIIEIIYVFIISIFPNWCDQYEEENPFPQDKKETNEVNQNNINDNNNNNNNNEINENANNENQNNNDEDKNKNNENNEKEVINDDNNNQNNEDEKNNKSHKNESNIINEDKEMNENDKEEKIDNIIINENENLNNESINQNMNEEKKEKEKNEENNKYKKIDKNKKEKID